MIKLINYKKYASKEVFISKAMIHSMQREGDITNITMDLPPLEPYPVEQKYVRN